LYYVGGPAAVGNYTGGRFLEMLLSGMPLTPVRSPGIATPAGVSFGMLAGATSIRIIVAREVFEDVEGAAPDKLADIAKFNAFRRQFEAIASDKFDRGERRPIKITKADIIKFAADQRADSPSS
jgi:hypothetical protein